ncbi:MAG: hypothetical protein OEY28_13520 [Nitrospira sp.]|nr:hypothetical protein [Nitrospira sp.]
MGILTRGRVVVLAALSLVVGSCAGFSAAEQERKISTFPDDVQADWPLVKERCSSCHSLDRVFVALETMSDRADVYDLVEEMADEGGSPIADDEIDPITDFLEYYRAEAEWESD